MERVKRLAGNKIEQGIEKPMIRLQRIYNFLLFHAILYSVLDIIELYYTLLYYFWD